jgi:hypothetical protein
VGQGTIAHRHQLAFPGRMRVSTPWEGQTAQTCIRDARTLDQGSAAGQLDLWPCPPSGRHGDALTGWASRWVKWRRQCRKRLEEDVRTALDGGIKPGEIAITGTDHIRPPPTSP